MLPLSIIAAQTTEQHCIAEADVFDATSGEVVHRGDGVVTCFDTIAEAVYAASNGSIVLPPDVLSSELTPDVIEQYQTGSASQSGVGARSNYLLATYWENQNKGGSSISIWSGTDCSIFYHTGYSVMPAGWDNRVSSTQSYSACGFNELSENTNHTGAKINCGYTGCASSAGLLDNQTSSTYLAP
jgi:hypothetical protein